MGENGVYRKQFYTKLVSSCHFMFLYLHMQLLPLLRKKTREGEYFFFRLIFFFPQCKSNACLCLHKVIRSSWLRPSNSFPWHVVSLPLSEMCLCFEMIKDPVRPPSHCGSSSQSRGRSYLWWADLRLTRGPV